MPAQRRAVLGATAVAAVVAACGGTTETTESTDTTTSTADTGVALANIQAAFQNFASQPSAHLRIVEQGANPATFDLDVTKDALSGSVTNGGTSFGIVYVGGHGYVQTAPRGAYTQVADADARAFGLFTIGALYTCYPTLMGPGGTAARFSGPGAMADVTINGASGVDYMATDGSGDVAISNGSPPLPLKLQFRTTASSASSVSSASSTSTLNPGCDVGVTNATSSDTARSIEVDWTYPGLVTQITPPAAPKG